MHPDIKEILCTEEQIKAKVAELGAQITKDYAGSTDGPVLVCILRGSCIFTADLCRAIDLPVKLDFMSVSSYQNGTTSTGRVQIIKDLSDPIEGKDVILVEDILDSGNTLFYLKELLMTRKPKSVKVCTLLEKPARLVKPIYADYCGFTVPDSFVVGYGLDYAENYRNLPYVGVLKPSVYGGE
jgi:hypoxanthine phosphoribosyltransferase